MPFRRTGAIFTFTPEVAVGSKRPTSCLPRSTKRRKIGVLKRSKSSHRPSPLQPTLASTITSTPPAHATMAIRPRTAVAALLQAAMRCSLVTAKARCEKEGLEDLHEYVNSLSPTLTREQGVQEVGREGLQKAEKGSVGNRMDGMMEVWEWGSKSGFRWSDRELRGCVRTVAMLETIWEEEEEGW